MGRPWLRAPPSRKPRNNNLGNHVGRAQIHHILRSRSESLVERALLLAVKRPRNEAVEFRPPLLDHGQLGGIRGTRSVKKLVEMESPLRGVRTSFTVIAGGQ